MLGAMRISLDSARALLQALVTSSQPYSDRATRVDTNLWLGPRIERADVAHIVERMRVKLILDCGDSENPSLASEDLSGVKRMRCPMLLAGSTVNVNMSDLAACMRAGVEALERKAAVLVHGRDGLYNAPSVAYGILRLRGLSMLEATRAVARRHAAIPRFIEPVEAVVMKALPASRWNP